jgi:DNA-damage-inducible protein J
MGTMAESAAMVHVQAQAKVSADVRRRVAEVLEREGITVDEAFEQMLTRTAADGVSPFTASGDEDEDPAYDAWFRAKVQESLDDPRPAVSHEEMRRRMESRRAEARARLL